MATDIPQQYVPTVSESEALLPDLCPNVDHLITEDDTPWTTSFPKSNSGFWRKLYMHLGSLLYRF